MLIAFLTQFMQQSPGSRCEAAAATADHVKIAMPDQARDLQKSQTWGAMLVSGYLGLHPERVSHAVMVEPGMLTPEAARELVIWSPGR